jgi:16S rRNA processing protein RimM
LLVVRSPAGEELLIPFVRAYLRNVDIEGKRLEMDLPRGLLNLQARGAEDAE